jgi:hypothetical protein
MSPVEMLEGKPPNLTNVVAFGSPCMVYRSPGKYSLKKRSQCGLILGVSEEVKGFRVYLMDDKKVINTQHVKYIETLSRAQNHSLLSDGESNVAGSEEVTGLAPATADSHPVGGASAPTTPTADEPVEPPAVERMTTRTSDKRKPTRRLHFIIIYGHVTR